MAVPLYMTLIKGGRNLKWVPPTDNIDDTGWRDAATGEHVGVFAYDADGRVFVTLGKRGPIIDPPEVWAQRSHMLEQAALWKERVQIALLGVGGLGAAWFAFRWWRKRRK